MPHCFKTNVESLCDNSEGYRGPSAQQEESNLYECPSCCWDWWNIWVMLPGPAQSASGLSAVETFLCPLVVGNVGTAPTIRTTRHELPLICAIFFQPNEVLWEDKNEVLVLRFRHLYNIILILHCQWG